MDAAIVSRLAMENYGYDFIVNAMPIRTKDFTWQLAINRRPYAQRGKG